jgi:5'-phosphate synthase pdxT subunit
VTIGILALQGDVREHAAALAELGADARAVRRPAELEGLAGLVLPGGESTTLSMLLESSGLFDPLREAIAAGLPTLGTCAGLVLLSSRVVDGRPDQRTFGALDCTVRRNGYGRQRESFEAVVAVEGSLDDTHGSPAHAMPAVFIRAPVVEAVGPSVEVVARLRDDTDGSGEPVAVRQGHVVASAFHPELTPDRRLHRLLLSLAAGEGSTLRGARGRALS